MTSSNKDNSMEYNKEMYKKREKPKNHLAARLNMFQEKVNQTKAPHSPQVESVHDQHPVDSNVLNEIKHVFQLIKDHGQQGDYAMQIPFAELVSIFGNAQIEKLVEILANGRKHGYINYTPSDPLELERDEETFIRLIRTPY